MEEQLEPWELPSGTWLRDPVNETWRVAVLWDGTVVDNRLPPQDVARLIGARREPTSGAWFPPEFDYSQQTGAPLRMTIPTLESPWSPPFGEYAPGRTKSPRGGLRQTPLPLALARAHERSVNDEPDRTLPPLPLGNYRFVVDKFGASCPTLIAVDPQRGHLLLLLPESRDWVRLDRAAGVGWGQRLRHLRGWRMELVHADGHATAYCPSGTGLAAIAPNAIALSYTVEHSGAGPAIGSPVAWKGVIWLPVLGRGGVVELVGKTHGVAYHVVMPTNARVPPHGFEAPVFDEVHVNWPCEEGQLVLRLDAHGNEECSWIDWPDRIRPLFEMGCAYRQPSGVFWQLCCENAGGGFEYVQMASAAPAAARIDAATLCTGSTCYRDILRIDSDPWGATAAADHATTDIVVPLLESAHDRTVIGLKVDAPRGLLALLHAGNEPCDAVLQVQGEGRPAAPFATLKVQRPWIAQLFVYDGHLWLEHPELPQALGWKLAL